ncbi:MAG TPA: biopolymer transporter ExbD [Gammaproteobacteria bacterium]|nr:biopolymer transporter ExbD [Gammaproteobacteria bacterium]
MKLRRSREYRRGRIEIIPMIDVMFFLLATFMLASLSMQNLHSLAVNLPKGQAAPISHTQPVTLTVTKKGRIYLNHTPVTLDTLAGTLKPMLKHHGSSVVVAADRDSRDGVVVRAMLEARKAGADQLLIAVKHQ